MRPLAFGCRLTLLVPVAVLVGCDRSPTFNDQIANPHISAAAATSGFVTRSGTQLLLDGIPYRFTGLNIYNANSRANCWYTMGTGTTLARSLVAIGPGNEAFRAWFFQFLATTNGQRDWGAFDHTLAAARARGVKVVATLTNQWGDCETTGYKTDSWYTDGYKQPDPGGIESYRDWVAEVVTRYANDPTILAWQLVNEAEIKPYNGAECSVGAATILQSFAADVSGLVKSLDPNHLVSLGTMGGGQCGAQSSEYQDVYSVPTVDLCEYHDYSPSAAIPGDQFNGLQVRIDQCNALGKPLFVGETGIIPDSVGGTFAARGVALLAKLRAQFGAGVVGDLVWAWDTGGSLLNNYDVGPADTVLKVLGKFWVPTSLAFAVQPSGVDAGHAMAPAVQVAVLDALGDTVKNFSGSVTITLGTHPAGATLSGTTTITPVAGIATFADLTFTKPGTTYKLKATSTGLTAATSNTFLVGPSGATKLIFKTQPSTTQAGKGISPAIVVVAQDSFGNTAAGFTGNVTLQTGTNPGGGTLFGAVTQAAILGTATFKNVSIDRTGVGYTLQATSDMISAATSTTFNITAAVATQLVFAIQPSSTAAGAAMTPTVQIQAFDAFSNLATGFAGKVTIKIGTNPTGGSLSGTTVVTASGGIASFPGLSINRAGTGYTLQATNTGRPSATSAPFNIFGAATHLAFTVQPSNAVAGSVISPAVQVTAQDALGNRVVTFAGSVAIGIGTNPASGVLSGTTTVGTQSGIATFTNLSIDKPGTGYTLQGTAIGLAAAASTAFNISSAMSPIQPIVAAGWFHTCVLKSDATVACWGSNTYAGAPDQPFLGQATPPAGVTFTQVSAGGYHTCGIKSDGTIQCWGDNSNGAAPPSQSPPLGTTFTQVSAGGLHTCALVSDGSIACWGYDGYGQATPPTGTTFTQISSGGYHTCARVNDGSVTCWGRPDDGQIATPGGATFTQVSAGGFHTCALMIDGTVNCWGNNSQGQATPPVGATFTQLGSGGAFQTCGIHGDHSIGCWGGNIFIEGTPPAGTEFTQVSGGYHHACALQSDGTVVCWGDNTYGQAAPPAGFMALAARGR